MSESHQENSAFSPRKGEKRPSEDLDVGAVHSSNSWESAELGDQDRKKKFLRLMGAGKKSHQGRFVIGETHGKHVSANESQKRSEEIEQQFTHTLESKVSGSFRKHHGIGFEEPEPGPEPELSAIPDESIVPTSTSSDSNVPELSEKGTRKDDSSIGEVSSSNSWETADLGDDDRKKKFLKLMGAGKKSHQGRFVIGESTARHVKAQESQQASEAVEKQFIEAMAKKSAGGFRGRGIGFVPEEKTNPDSTNPEQQPKENELKPDSTPGMISSGFVPYSKEEQRSHHDDHRQQESHPSQSHYQPEHSQYRGRPDVHQHDQRHSSGRGDYHGNTYGYGTSSRDYGRSERDNFSGSSYGTPNRDHGRSERDSYHGNNYGTTHHGGGRPQRESYSGNSYGTSDGHRGGHGQDYQYQDRRPREGPSSGHQSHGYNYGDGHRPHDHQSQSGPPDSSGGGSWKQKPSMIHFQKSSDS